MVPVGWSIVRCGAGVPVAGRAPSCDLASLIFFHALELSLAIKLAYVGLACRPPRHGSGRERIVRLGAHSARRQGPGPRPACRCRCEPAPHLPAHAASMGLGPRTKRAERQRAAEAAAARCVRCVSPGAGSRTRRRCAQSQSPAPAGSVPATPAPRQSLQGAGVQGAAGWISLSPRKNGGQLKLGTLPGTDLCSSDRTCTHQAAS